VKIGTLVLNIVSYEESRKSWVEEELVNNL